MASFPTGVSVVTTTGPEGEKWGMTCTSLCSVSLDPPTLLVCLRCGSPTLDAIRSVGTFAVNLLHDGARPTAELFASGDPKRFDQVEFLDGEGRGGPHLTQSAHMVADCTIVGDPVVGTHTVVMGKVERVVTLRRKEPLLYGLRRFASWSEAVGGTHLFYDFIS